MGEIHDRQPVILEPREYGEWLAESERPPIALLRILGEEEMVVDPLGGGEERGGGAGAARVV